MLKFELINLYILFFVGCQCDATNKIAIKKLIVVLLGLRAQKVLFTPANYCINDFILIRFYKK
jgi:hypothetical protein